jgi:hypothetical protein
MSQGHVTFKTRCLPATLQQDGQPLLVLRADAILAALQRAQAAVAPAGPPPFALERAVCFLLLGDAAGARSTLGLAPNSDIDVDPELRQFVLVRSTGIACWPAGK